MTTIAVYFLAILSSAALGALCTYMYLQRKISTQIEHLENERIVNQNFFWHEGYKAAYQELYESEEESTGRHGKKTNTSAIAEHARA